MLKNLLQILPAFCVSSATVACDSFPTPTGGIQAIYKNVKYPDTAKKENIQGKVLIEVTILKDGSVGEIAVKESVHPDLDHAAVEAIRTTKWQPGSDAGKPSSCTVVVPIVFKLAAKSEKHSGTD
jgi:protein TonB